MVDEHPLREGFARRLMVALYRTGRQADALRAYAKTRGVLADELGLDPTPELVELQTAILNHDPDLAAPASTWTPPAAAGGARRGRRAGRRRGAGAAGPVARAAPRPGDAGRPRRVRRPRHPARRAAEGVAGDRRRGQPPRAAAGRARRRQVALGRRVRRRGARRRCRRAVGPGHGRGDRPVRADGRGGAGRPAGRVQRGPAPRRRRARPARLAAARPRAARAGGQGRAPRSQRRALPAVRDRRRAVAQRVGGPPDAHRPRRPAVGRRPVAQDDRARAAPRAARAG